MQFYRKMVQLEPIKADRRLTVRGEKEQRIVHSWAPLYCVDFLLYLQTLEVVELWFVRLELGKELVVTCPSYLTARAHLQQVSASPRGMMLNVVDLRPVESPHIKTSRV